MAKLKSKFVCQECGYETAKWLGRCPSCEEWNTFVEEFESKGNDPKSQRGISKGVIEKINNITSTKKERISTGSMEMDRVLGGGIIKSSLILVGGRPRYRQVNPFVTGSGPRCKTRVKGTLCFRRRIGRADKNKGRQAGNRRRRALCPG
jgi:phage FluMu protein Com